MIVLLKHLCLKGPSSKAWSGNSMVWFVFLFLHWFHCDQVIMHVIKLGSFPNFLLWIPLKLRGMDRNCGSPKLWICYPHKCTKLSTTTEICMRKQEEVPEPKCDRMEADSSWFKGKLRTDLSIYKITLLYDVVTFNVAINTLKFNLDSYPLGFLAAGVYKALTDRPEKEFKSSDTSWNEVMSHLLSRRHFL